MNTLQLFCSGGLVLQEETRSISSLSFEDRTSCFSLANHRGQKPVVSPAGSNLCRQKSWSSSRDTLLTVVYLLMTHKSHPPTYCGWLEEWCVWRWKRRAVPPSCLFSHWPLLNMARRSSVLLLSPIVFLTSGHRSSPGMQASKGANTTASVDGIWLGGALQRHRK